MGVGLGAGAQLQEASVECPPPRSFSEDVSLTPGLYCLCFSRPTLDRAGPDGCPADKGVRRAAGAVPHVSKSTRAKALWVLICASEV